MQFEKIVFRGINTDISPKVVDSNGNRRVLNPLVEARNCRYSVGESGTFEAVSNIKSTLKLFDFPEAGENTVIGTYFDKWNNAFLYFVHNSSGRHGIYAINQPDTANPTVTNLVTDPACLNRGLTSTPLLFEKYKYVHSVVVVDKILFWQYNGLVRRVKMFSESAYEATQMATVVKSLKETLLICPSPILNLRPVRDSNFVANTDNKIQNNNYQFAARYVLFDNTVTALGPYSYFNFNRNRSDEKDYKRISFRISTTDRSLVSVVKQTQILFRRSESDDWKIAEKIDGLPDFTINLLVRFDDSQSYEVVPTDETAKIFDSVPIQIENLSFLKNRIFITADLEGNKIDGNCQLNLSLTTSTNSVEPSINDGTLYFKSGGNYGFGLVFFDEQLRTSGVVSRTSLTIPYGTATLGLLYTYFPKVLASVTGTPPSDARYFSIVRTNNRKQANYMQIPVKAMFYLGEFQTGGSIPTDYWEFSNGKIYSGKLVDSSGYNYVHFQLPDNLPYVPSVGDTVRILNSFANGAESKILDYDGQVIVCGNFDIQGQWSIPSTGFIMIEIYSEQEVQEEYFFDCSPLLSLYDSSNNYIGFSGQRDLIGDTHVFGSSANQYKFTNLRKNSDADLDIYKPSQKFATFLVESPTPVFTENNNVIVTPKKPTKRESEVMLRESWKSLRDNNPSTKASDIGKKFKVQAYTKSGSTSMKAPDYTKVTGQVTRVYVPALNEPVKRNNVIRFSNTYVEDSNINGLAKFDALNEYTISGDRTPIRKLQAVGNVLLAIHEQNITSLYVGEGFIREADGNEALIKTRDVIGQDRLLAGGFGTKNPESIAANENMCFGWDVVKGCVWRYTNAGVIAVSDFGKKDYFLSLAKKFQLNPNGVRVTGAIDEYHKEYIITFIKTDQSLDFENQTWVFNYGENYWAYRADFVPQAWSFNGNILLSYTESGVWIHNDKRINTFNNFYNQQYPRTLKVLMNFAPFKSKVALALQIAQENLYDSGDNLPVVKVSGWSDFDNIATTNQQETEMVGDDFELQENVYYGPVLKDKNSVVPNGLFPTLHGDDIRDQVFSIELTNRTNKPAKLYYLNLGYIFSEYGN